MEKAEGTIEWTEQKYMPPKMVSQKLLFYVPQIKRPGFNRDIPERWVIGLISDFKNTPPSHFAILNKP